MVDTATRTTPQAHFPQVRLRRLRQSQTLRRMVNDVSLCREQMILPLFIKEGISAPQAISSMPGHYQWPLSHLPDFIKKIQASGVAGVMLFGIPARKDATGSPAIAADGIVQQAIACIKTQAPDLLAVADLCFCEYTSHGHCGVMAAEHLDNDATLDMLGRQAVSLANKGADMIAPSGMVDGMVAHVRQALDKDGFNNVPIMSYAVKYSSHLYGPFREAAQGAPQFGDRRGYQADPANTYEALREADMDVQEGADILMVKPALAYLDVITRVKARYPELPMAAYHVSGEYSMVKAAAQRGWIDGNAVMLEHLLAIRRAGAQILITYAALELDF